MPLPHSWRTCAADGGSAHNHEHLRTRGSHTDRCSHDPVGADSAQTLLDALFDRHRANRPVHRGDHVAQTTLEP